MVNVIGPLLSLSASGLIGKTIFYYDTKFGARARKPKTQFTPPGAIWEINKEWFKQASDRCKQLTADQKAAWKVAYAGECDVWRDIFMGQQIQLWNLSPTNDLTWPPVGVSSIGEIIFGGPAISAFDYTFWFDKYDYDKFRKYTCGSLWWLKQNDSSPPTPSDEYKFSSSTVHTFTLEHGYTSYLWGGVRYLDGGYKAVFLGSYFL